MRLFGSWGMHLVCVPTNNEAADPRMEARVCSNAPVQTKEEICNAGQVHCLNHRIRVSVAEANEFLSL